jgi:hypothetical protein
MSKWIKGYRMTTGWIGKPGANAPSLNEIKDLPFVVVPSGNNNTDGNSMLAALLCHENFVSTVIVFIIAPSASWCLKAY